MKYIIQDIYGQIANLTPGTIVKIIYFALFILIFYIVIYPKLNKMIEKSNRHNKRRYQTLKHDTDHLKEEIKNIKEETNKVEEAMKKIEEKMINEQSNTNIKFKTLCHKYNEHLNKTQTIINYHYKIKIIEKSVNQIHQELLNKISQEINHDISHGISGDNSTIIKKIEKNTIKAMQSVENKDKNENIETEDTSRRSLDDLLHYIDKNW